MRALGSAAAGLLAGMGAMALSPLPASAAIVCSGNACWHTTTRYEYPADAHVTIHEDSWKAEPGITFREHEGRGYWRGESWVDF
jgi:hypothetical protein